MEQLRVVAAPAGGSTRHLKRIRLAADTLRAAGLQAGDAVVLSSSAVDLTSTLLSSLSLDAKPAGPTRPDFAVGIAWPDFALGEQEAAASPVMLANSSLRAGANCSVCKLAGSGVQVREAQSMTVILDRKSGASTSKASDAFFEAFVRETLVDLSYLAVHHFVELTFSGAVRRVLVSSATAVDTESSGTTGARVVYLVTRSTKVVFKAPGTVSSAPKAAPVVEGEASEDKALKKKSGDELPGYDSIGGLESQIEQIRELVEWPLTRPELYRHFGLRPPRGILLHGPPGTGKTLLAFSIARSTRASLFVLEGSSLASAYHGETESRLRAVFEKARKEAPAVVVIDEIDALAPRREDAGEVDKRVVATLLTLMDGLGDKGESGAEEGKVFVIAATNRPNAIDPALRRPGRFDREIEIGVPNASARRSILDVLLRKTPHTLNSDYIATVAAKTHGFVGADLAALVHSAGLRAIKRCFLAGSDSDSTADASRFLTTEDVESALVTTRPSAMREVMLEVPKVSWSDIGGLAQIKERMRESVEWPLLHPEAFKRLGVRPPRGVLLYGPPGCSKTLVARAVAASAGLNFISVKGPEIFNKYVGESERAVRDLFKRARLAAPSIIFLDELDALATSRGGEDTGTGDRVLMSLLTEMDGMEELNGVMVLAATNRPDVIDPALLRPGRLDRLLYVSPPDVEARQAIFKVNFQRMSVAEDVSIVELALQTDGCSGAEIAAVCQDAAIRAMAEDIAAPSVSRAHFMAAASGVRRGITSDMIKFFESWKANS